MKGEFEDKIKDDAKDEDEIKDEDKEGNEFDEDHYLRHKDKSIDEDFEIDINIRRVSTAKFDVDDAHKI